MRTLTLTAAVVTGMFALLVACDDPPPRGGPTRTRRTVDERVSVKGPARNDAVDLSQFQVPGGPPIVAPAAGPGVGPAGAPPPGTSATAAGGVTWTAPDEWRAQAPSSNMRAAEFAFGEASGPQAVMAVFFFGPGQGGSIDDNVQRWVGQFRQADGRDSMQAAEIGHRQVNGLEMTLVDVTGAYEAGMGMGGGGPTPASNQRLLAAIAVGPQGPVFFKMVGPVAVMDLAEPSFDEFVRSIRPE